jgi:hypothetical protein
LKNNVPATIWSPFNDFKKIIRASYRKISQRIIFFPIFLIIHFLLLFIVVALRNNSVISGHCGGGFKLKLSNNAMMAADGRLSSKKTAKN